MHELSATRVHVHASTWSRLERASDSTSDGSGRWLNFIYIASPNISLRGIARYSSESHHHDTVAHTTIINSGAIATVHSRT